MLPLGAATRAVPCAGIGARRGVDAHPAGGARKRREEDSMFEPGVMFWAERDDLEMVRSLGVRYGQLGIPGGMQLTDGVAVQWKTALAAAGFTLVTVFAAYEGEDYADIPAVARTVGFVPPNSRAARLARTLAVSDFAALLGVASIACHDRKSTRLNSSHANISY